MRHITPKKIRITLKCGHDIHCTINRAKRVNKNDSCGACKSKATMAGVESEIVEKIKKNNFTGDLYLLMRFDSEEDREIIQLLKDLNDGSFEASKEHIKVLLRKNLDASNRKPQSKVNFMSQDEFEDYMFG